MNNEILVCKGLSKSYSSSKSVLKDLDLVLGAGRIVGLLGPNGCGKTTLLRILPGVMDYDEGDVVIAPYAINGRSQIAPTRAHRGQLCVLIVNGKFL